MHETLKALAVLDSAPAGCGLATIAAVDGSSYRRPGARLVLTPDGRRFGSISGGCLEEDLVLHLQQVMASGISRTLVYDTTAENDLVWGVGLGCNGKVTLLLEKVSAPPTALAFVRTASGERRGGTVLATVYDADSPDLLGTKLGLAKDDNEWRGPLSPAAWMPPLLTAAQRALAQACPFWLHLPDLAGRPRVFIEYIPPPPHLAVFGAGDDAQPLVRFARELGWTVTVADPRPAHATAARFPEANRVLALRPEEIPGRVTLDTHTFAVVMTHHYVHDLPLIRLLLPLPLAYLGLLGPRQRGERILGELEAGGLAITPAMRARLHSPVGLDLGGDTPEAVALSMLAEMQSVLDARDARPLRERTRPIHG